MSSSKMLATIADVTLDNSTIEKVMIAEATLSTPEDILKAAAAILTISNCKHTSIITAPFNNIPVIPYNSSSKKIRITSFESNILNSYVNQILIRHETMNDNINSILYLTVKFNENSKLGILKNKSITIKIFITVIPRCKKTKILYFEYYQLIGHIDIMSKFKNFYYIFTNKKTVNNTNISHINPFINPFDKTNRIHFSNGLKDDDRIKVLQIYREWKDIRKDILNKFILKNNREERKIKILRSELKDLESQDKITFEDINEDEEPKIKRAKLKRREDYKYRVRVRNTRIKIIKMELEHYDKYFTFDNKYEENPQNFFEFFLNKCEPHIAVLHILLRSRALIAYNY